MDARSTLWPGFECMNHEGNNEEMMELCESRCRSDRFSVHQAETNAHGIGGGFNVGLVMYIKWQKALDKKQSIVG